MKMNDHNMRRISNMMMRQRVEYKQLENRNKPPLIANDVVTTTDFVFSAPFEREGDSGKLLLAKQKSNRSNRYFVKHEFTDCACVEYLYTKLAQAMDYKMPDVVLFQRPESEKRKYFRTEYIIGARYLNIVDPFPSYEKVREQAQNWKQWFSFYGLYAMTGEVDGMEAPLVDDGYIYRVDTTAAFPISNWDLDYAGVYQDVRGIVPDDVIQQTLSSRDLKNTVNFGSCDFCYDLCQKADPQVFLKPFLEPFDRIQGIPDTYVDSVLNTLCYFYPDHIGDYLKRYVAALKNGAAKYLKTKR